MDGLARLINITKDQWSNKKEIWSERCVLISLAGIISYFFFTNVSMIQISGISLVFYFFFMCLVASIVMRLCISSKPDSKISIFLAILCSICIIGWRETGELEVLLFAIIILGCTGIKDNKIIKVFMVTTGVELVITVAAALLGKTENLIYYRGNDVRISFGTIYPTIFATQLLVMYFCWIYLKRSRLRIYMPFVGFAGGIFTYKLCGARTSMICFFMFSAVVLIGLLYEKFIQKEEKGICLNPFWGTLLVSSSVVCAGIIINLSLLYDKNQALWIKLNHLLSERLKIGNNAFGSFDITMLGQVILQKGNGGSTEAPLDYFYIDSAYVSYLLRYGLLVFVLLLLVMTLVNFFSWKNNNYILLLIMIMLSVHGIMEDRLMAIATNPFLWLVFSNMTTKGEKYVEKN